MLTKNNGGEAGELKNLKTTDLLGGFSWVAT